jgi:hypothetical protein
MLFAFDWWHELATAALAGFASSVLAGALLLWLGYKLVERRLRLEDERDRRQAIEDERTQYRQAVLGAVHRELEHAASQIQEWKGALSGEEYGVPDPGLDVGAWPLVTQAAFFTVLQQETIEALTHAYNRMNSVNGQLAFLADLNHGPTAITVNASVAGRLDHAQVNEAFDKFRAHRDAVRGGLVSRLADLKPRLDDAIDAVEAELGLKVQNRAADRHYVPTTPAEIIGPPGT